MSSRSRSPKRQTNRGGSSTAASPAAPSPAAAEPGAAEPGVLHRASGTLAKHDEKTHVPLPFVVPEGLHGLEVRFSYAPVTPRAGLPHNEISLSLFDPLGCRGTRHNNRQLNVLLTADAATPGFVPRPLVGGEWCAVIDVHRVVPGTEVDYELEVRALDPMAALPDWAMVTADAPRIGRTPARETDVGRRPAQVPSFGQPSARVPDLGPLHGEYPYPRLVPTIGVPTTVPLTLGSHPRAPKGEETPRWYRGDLHAHSLHSDAGWDVPDLVAAARAEGLDFVSLTDHNTVSGVAELQAIVGGELLAVPGMELSTFRGHALALGIEEWQEWRVAPHTGSAITAPELFEAVKRRAGLVVMAHPMSIGSPWRSGSLWEYPDVMPGPLRCVEVWNGVWDGGSNNEQALQLFYLWLSLGHRLVATSGSDSHGPWANRRRVAFNHVWADELSVDGILGALADGRSYLSSGPRLAVSARPLVAESSAPATVLGGELPLGATVRVDVRWSGVGEGGREGSDSGSDRDCASGGDELRLIAEGEVRGTRTECAEAGHWTIVLDAMPAWFTIEVRDGEGKLLALTNPIYGAPGR